jgi:hypothetical protein
VGHVKIVHTAHIHLGTELYGHYDPLTGASSRLQDFAAALDHAVEAWRASLEAHSTTSFGPGGGLVHSIATVY